MQRLEAIALALPEASRVDIEAWDGEPTFRVNGKNFVFAHPEGLSITVKLDKEEAAAVVATDPDVTPTGYGLGRHGWVTVAVPEDLADDDRWQLLDEWVRESYRNVAPKRLAKLVD